MNGFRETKDTEINCVYCKHFCSYQDEYDDELEPWEYGRCDNVFNIGLDTVFGIDTICDLFKNLKKDENQTI